MSGTAVEALANADWKALSPRLQYFAHCVMARYQWRGLRVKVIADGRLTVGDRSPDDFVIEALEKLCDGTRAYRPELDLEANLRSVIESDIDNCRKKSARRRIVDRTAAEAVADPTDPVDSLPDERLADTAPGVEELRERQRKILDVLTEAVRDDTELSLVLLAYEDGKYKPSEIEKATDIPAARVSELKRKLQQRAEKLLKSRPELADVVREGAT